MRWCVLLGLLHLLTVRGLQAARTLAVNWRCGVEEVAAFSGQQKFLMPGIVLGARYAKMNKAECPPLVNSMLQRQESK